MTRCAFSAVRSVTCSSRTFAAVVSVITIAFLMSAVNHFVQFFVRQCADFPCRITLFPIDQCSGCRIRIFLSCSYFGYCHLVHTSIVLKLDMTGSVEPVFRFLTCRAVLCRGLSKAWQKKIPQRSEDDFLLANQPLKGAALRNQPDKWLYLQVRN